MKRYTKPIVLILVVLNCLFNINIVMAGSNIPSGQEKIILGTWCNDTFFDDKTCKSTLFFNPDHAVSLTMKYQRGEELTILGTWRTMRDKVDIQFTDVYIPPGQDPDTISISGMPLTLHAQVKPGLDTLTLFAIDRDGQSTATYHR